MDAVTYIQQNFFNDFPRHPLEEKYNFVTQSTLKATQISCAPGALNQLPNECTVQGDVRIAPFYDVEYPTENVSGTLNLKWEHTEGENGVACKLDSRGYDAIVQATSQVLGSAKPYSIGGSLPLIRDLQDQGFDVQISGYGISSRYA